MTLDFPHIHPDKPLMVVVDTSVLLHKLHQSIPMDHNDPQFESILKANLVWLMSGAWLGHDLRDRMAQMVFVKDVKPYWRSAWLADIRNTIDLPKNHKTKAKKAMAEEAKAILDKGAETVEELERLEELTDKMNVKYKEGRSHPEYKFTKIKKLVYRYLDALGAFQLYESGYEADDMAAALVATNTEMGSPWSIMLLTVDTDWLGLVNPSVTWCCMSGFAPVVRDRIEVVNQWAESRLKCTLGTWRDIWDIKGDQGDKSDNLPASDGQLLPVIDLLNPPSYRKYWELEPQKVGSMFRSVSPSFNLDRAKDAQTQLKMNGLQPVVKMLPNQRLEPEVMPAFSDEPMSDMVEMLADLVRLQTTPEGVF